MHTVWKYTLQPKIDLEIPEGAEILTVGSQGSEIVMWVKVDPGARKETRTFVGFGTGHDIPDKLPLTYIGTVSFENPALVFHIFES